MSTIREACGTATIVCGLLTPRYVTERCCSDKLQLDNVQEEEIGEVHEAVRSYSKSCLLAASPSWTLSWPSWGRRMRQSYAASPTRRGSPCGRRTTLST